MNKCKGCEGHGWQLRPGTTDDSGTCPECDGTGNADVSEEIKRVVENKRLLAEYLGVKYYDTPHMKVCMEDDYDGIFFHCEWHPQYTGFSNLVAWVFAPDKEWCQLIPVLEKIERGGASSRIERIDKVEWCWIWDDEYSAPVVSSSAKTKMEAIYNAVVEYVKLKG